MTIAAIKGQSGAAMLHDHMGRNHCAWLSIADFITLENLRSVLSASATAPGKRSAGAVALAAALAASQTLPDGNHGENLEVVQA